MGTLEIKLFGTLSLAYDGQPLKRFPSKRIKDLLSYLLLNRESLHAREKLAALFWGELGDPQFPRARQLISEAMRNLEGIAS